MRTYPQMRNDWRLPQPILVGFHELGPKLVIFHGPFAELGRALIADTQLAGLTGNLF
jgi:hypothetical protein